MWGVLTVVMILVLAARLELKKVQQYDLKD